MGTNLNRPGDSLDIGQFLRRWLDRYLAESNWIDEMWRNSAHASFGRPPGMLDDFLSTIEDHREAISDPTARWGWKVPRSIFVLPFVHDIYSGVQVIHLVRDGRDMAYSRNQNQVRAHGPRLLQPDDLSLPRPIRSIKFWSHVNLAAAHYGERFLNDNYLRLRYEDLCSDPPGAVTQVLDFLGRPAPGQVERIAAEVVQPSSSIGRWREQDPDEVEAIGRAGAEALREFGYL
jgi:hypothetical protein